jgi:hypothetical protein
VFCRVLATHVVQLEQGLASGRFFRSKLRVNRNYWGEGWVNCAGLETDVLIKVSSFPLFPPLTSVGIQHRYHTVNLLARGAAGTRFHQSRHGW